MGVRSVQPQTPGTAFTPALASGEGLARRTREFFEPRFGMPLDDVRVHADARAAEAAREVGANAFAVGADIVFAAGKYAPDSDEGRGLLAHELAHAAQAAGRRRRPGPAVIAGPDNPREAEASAAAAAVIAGRAPRLVHRALPDELLRQAVPAGYRRGVDPDIPLIEVPQPDRDEQETFAQAGLGPIHYRVTLGQPDLFLVPATASRAQIASALFGDASRVNDYDFVAPSAAAAPGSGPEVGVRARTPAALLPDAATMLRAVLDVAVRRDVDWTIDALKQRSIDLDDERALAERCLRWAQRSDITDPAGVSFFDRYLRGLSGVTLVQPHWYTLTLTETSHTALEWLLIESGTQSGPIKMAIEQRSALFRGSTGYTPTTSSKAPLAPGDDVGRYVWASGPFSGAGSPVQIDEKIVDEPTRERAEIATRNSPHLGMRLIIPAGQRWYGYTLTTPSVGSLHPDPRIDPGGRYYWYFPGAIPIRANEFQADFPVLGPAERAFRGTLLDTAIASSSVLNLQPLLGLDYDVLTQATLDQRIQMLTLLITTPGHTDAAFDAAARIVETLPDAEFPRFERRFTTQGLLLRVLSWNRPSKIALGRAFTLKAVSSLPIGADALARMVTLEVGRDTSGVRHMADTAIDKVTSRAVAPGSFQPGQSPAIGAEPALPGEKPGSFERSALRFKPLTYEVGLTTKPQMLPESRQLLPTELVRLEIVGSSPQTRIATAFEVATIASIADTSIFTEALIYAVNAALWARAGIGITRAFGGAIAGGLATGGVGAAIRAATAVAASEAGRQALRAFLTDVLILGSMSIVDRYRDELEATEAGRAFLALYDIALTALVARDVYKLLSSGVLTELATRGVAALRAVGTSARLGLMHAIDDLQALADAWRSMREAGELVEAQTNEGIKFLRPRSEGTFRQYFLSARAKVVATRILASFSGATRTLASRVFQRLERLAAGNEEVARAFSAAARRVEALSASAAEDYLSAIERLLNSSRRGIADGVAGFIRASARAARPVVYLGRVEALMARAGVSNEAVVQLGVKAGGGQLDLEWLMGTRLTDDQLSFLGADARTPWNLFKSAAKDANELRWATARLRGIAAEMVTGETSRLVPGYRISGRQVAMGTSELDFSLTSTDRAGRQRGLEVKGWTRQTWKEALDAFQKNAKGRRLSAAERTAMEKVDHMLGQLQDARAATRNPPVLAVTDDLGPVRAQLDDVLRSNAPRGTDVVTIPEDAIKNLRRELSKALGLE